MSSRSDTANSSSHGTPQVAIPIAGGAGARHATGSHPAQIASPPTRGMGAVCSERALRSATGSRSRSRRRSAVATAASAAAASVDPAAATLTSNSRFRTGSPGRRPRRQPARNQGSRRGPDGGPPPAG